MAEDQEEDVTVGYKKVKEQECCRSKGLSQGVHGGPIGGFTQPGKGILKSSSDGVWAQLGQGLHVISRHPRRDPSAYLACRYRENLFN